MIKSMKKAIKLILLLSMMGLIFYFSSQPSNDSIVTTNGFIDIIYKFYAFVFGNNSLSICDFTSKYFSPIRKLAHFTEFGMLGLLIYINVKEYFNKRYVLYSVIFSCLYALSDEIHQIFIPGRYCALKDVLIDSAGATLTILLMHLLSKKCLKK